MNQPRKLYSSLIGSFALALACVYALPGAAQNYPAKPVRIIIPFAPGGSNDILGRMIGTRLSELSGQQFIMDNRGGAGGTIGMDLATRASPDGYTLVIGHIGTLAVNPTLYPKLSYDPVKDLQPVSMFAKVANMLAVHPSLPARSVREFIDLAKAKPGALSYGSGGTGGGGHLAMEYFKLLANIDCVHVPYKGTAPAIVDLLAGQTQVVFAGIPPVAVHVRAGRLRALGVSTNRRLAIFPELPTVAESGVPGFEATQWYGLAAPAGTASAIVDILNRYMRSAIQNPKVEQRLVDEGAEAAASTPDEFAAFIKNEITRWRPVVKSIAIRAE